MTFLIDQVAREFQRWVAPLLFLKLDFVRCITRRDLVFLAYRRRVSPVVDLEHEITSEINVRCVYPDDHYRGHRERSKKLGDPCVNDMVAKLKPDNIAYFIWLCIYFIGRVKNAAQCCRLEWDWERDEGESYNQSGRYARETEKME